LAQLNVLMRMSKVQEMEPRASHQVFIDVPLHKEPLGKISWVTDASVAHPTDVVPVSIAPLSATHPCAFKIQRSHANPTDASFANDHGVSRADGRCPKSS
jgi:hypothetical protein